MSTLEIPVRQDQHTVHRAARLQVAPPPLENGDRLTRAEFERRYGAMPHVKKAELIEGVVYMPSPVGNYHAESHGRIVTWLGVYCAATPGVHLADNLTVRLDADNEVQPDVLLRLDAAVGGNAQIGDDDYLEGAPEMIVEIASSSASYDLYDKLKVYRRNGVQEYIVWQVLDQHLDWFRLEEEEYVPQPPNADGVICSRVFPGLHLATTALLVGDMATVLAELKRGTETKEHAAFVERLSQAQEVEAGTAR